MVTNSLSRVQCPKCEHKWFKRTENPVQCPNCKYRPKEKESWR